MFKPLAILSVLSAAWIAVAATSSALPADRLALAKEFARRGLHAEALKELEAMAGAQGIAEDEYLYRLGEEYRVLGRMAESLAQSRRIVSEYPKSKYADYARLAISLSSEGEERCRLLEQLEGKDVPKAVRDSARYHLAAHRAQSSDPAVRRQALAAYLDMAGSSDMRVAADALYFAGMLSYREKRYKESAALFSRLMKTCPDSSRASDARPYAAWSNHLIGKSAETLALAEPLAHDGKDEDAAYLVAVSLRALVRREEAIKAIDFALKAFPEGRYADTLWTERLALLSAKGDHRGVLSMLVARGDPPPAMADRVLTLAYDSAAALGEWKVALQFARRVCALSSPFAGRARFMAGAFEARLGNSAEAIRIWTGLLAADPDSQFAADALKSRAMEELRIKEYRAANRSFAELSRRFPAKAGDVQMLYWRGVAARGADDQPEAEKLFAAALAAGPSPEFAREIQLERAYLLHKRGDEKGAVQAMSELLGTKAIDRLPDSELAWLAEAALSQNLPDAARVAAETLEKRTGDKAWRQIAAGLVGEALDRKGMRDAAAAAYRRALKVDAHTGKGLLAALQLGRYEMAAGNHDEAARLLADAAQHAQTKETAGIRMHAYAALAANEDARGAEDSALGYYMLVATLFDDDKTVPPAMRRAAEILRKQGKVKEAEELSADMKKRYGH